MQTFGNCRLHIPNFIELAKPLYQSLEGNDSLNFGDKEKEAFQTLKEALASASALGLPDITMPFHLFLEESITGWQRYIDSDFGALEEAYGLLV